MQKTEQKGLQVALTQFPVTGKTPAELVLGRQIRTRLDLLYQKIVRKVRKDNRKERKR